MVLSVDVEVALLLPVWSVIPPAGMVAVTSPSLVAEIVTSNVVPSEGDTSVTESTVTPVAVEFDVLTSVAVNELTSMGSSKTTSNVTVDPALGSVCPAPCSMVKSGPSKSQP